MGCQIGLADDFLDRVRQKVKPKFVERVIPTDLMLYLSLPKIEEEHVTAQKEQRGNMHAAGILFDYIIRKKNWVPELVDALKNREVGLADLAAEIENVLVDIPVRWDIISFTDGNGQACFDGNCPSPTSTVDTSISPDQTEVKDVFPGHETPRESVEVLEARFANISMTDMPNETHEERERRVNLEREDLRTKVMEKIFSFVNKPEDLSIACFYFDRLGLKATSIDKGSIILTFKMEAMQDLQYIQTLMMDGTLKTIIDKELMSTAIIKELEELTIKEGKTVRDIESTVYVHETDIQRCRSWLLCDEDSNDVVSATTGVTLLNLDKTRQTDPKTRKMSKLVKDHLPQPLKEMLTDTFIIGAIHKFYKSPELQKVFEQDTEQVNKHMECVSEMFLAWVEREVIAFLDRLKKEDKQSFGKVILLRFFLPHIRTPDIFGKHTHLSISRSTCTMHTSDNTITIKKGNPNPRIDYFRLGEEINFEKDQIKSMYSSLETNGIMVKTHNSGYEFVSDLLHDVCLASLVKLDTLDDHSIPEHYPYLVHFLARMHCNDTAYVYALTENCLGQLSVPFRHRQKFKPMPDSKETIIHTSLCEMNRAVVRDAKQLLLYQPIDTEQHIHDEIVTLYQDLQGQCSLQPVVLEGKQKYEIHLTAGPTLYVQLYLIQKHFLVHVHGMRPETPVHLTIITPAGDTLSDVDLAFVNSFIGVAPEVKSMNLSKSHLEQNVLKDSLLTGNFSNIRHLNLSQNGIIPKQVPGNLGLSLLPNLETLDMGQCGLGDKGINMVAKDFQYLAKLKELIIPDNDITGHGLMDLSFCLASNTALIKLSLQGNPLGEEGCHGLAGWLKRLVLLEELNISRCGLHNKSMKAIANSLVSRTLRKLSMRENAIISDGLDEFFSSFNKPKTFEHIDFSGNKLFNDGNSTVYDTESGDPLSSFLEGDQVWDHVSLWQCSIGTHRIFRTAEKFSSMRHLTYLCLQDNQLDDEFVIDLANVIDEYCEFLTHLNLRENQIGIGAKVLANSLTRQIYMTEIYLDRNHIDDRTGRQVARACWTLPKLSLLNLACNFLEQETVNDLARELSAEIKTVKDLTEAFIFTRANSNITITRQGKMV